MVQQNLQTQTSEAELHSLQNQWQQVTRCVRQLVIKSVQHYLMHGVTMKFTPHVVKPVEPTTTTLDSVVL